MHLGKGQSDATVYLEPGSHDLCVQVGDGEHHALDVTDTIKVDVGIDDLDQWCGVVGEIDGMFEETDNSSDDFAVKQVSYENIRRLLTQVHDSLDVVDAELAPIFENADYGSTVSAAAASVAAALS